MTEIKIIILNGSPKGMKSVTMQYINYLEKRFPDYSFTYIAVAQKSIKYEKDNDALLTDLEKISDGDLIIWAYPLYFLAVCSQYKRFVELLFERKLVDYFKNKYTVAISTSIHFFDNTALNYIHSICDDMEMNFLDSITAKMDDLRSEKFRKSFDHSFLEWSTAIERKTVCLKHFAPVKNNNFIYSPEIKDVPEINTNTKARVCIVGDLEEPESNIRKMAETAASAFKATGAEIEVIDLSSFKFGPCIGCMKCGFDNICTYTGKDQFIDIHRKRILSSDIILFAGKIHDRYLSHLWQRYLDRSFNKTHIPTLTGKQVGFLISGPFLQADNIKTILQGYIEISGGCIAGLISDDVTNSTQITTAIYNLCEKMINRFAVNYFKPWSFLGESGHKIFRDNIYSHLKFVFQVDNKYYKKNKLYDFPQKKRLKRLATFIMIALTKIPVIRKRINKELNNAMISQYQKGLCNVKPYKKED